MPTVVNLLYGSNQLASYDAQSTGSATATAPRVMRERSWMGVYWNTGLIIQNVATSGDAVVLVRYYYNSGAQAGGTYQYTIGPNEAFVIYPVPLGNGFLGSAEIYSTNGKPLVVLVNHQHLTANGDMLMNYIGIRP
jgi:hypothetical protein